MEPCGTPCPTVRLSDKWVPMGTVHIVHLGKEIKFLTASFNGVHRYGEQECGKKRHDSGLQAFLKVLQQISSLLSLKCVTKPWLSTYS